MTERTSFTADEARHVGDSIGLDWATAPFDVEQFAAPVPGPHVLVEG